LKDYTDSAAITQVIGCVFNDASILDDERYIIREDDFVDEFHKIVFGSMYRIHENNSKVNLDAIVDYLANRPKYNAVFQTRKGIDYLIEAAKIAK
jgi:replicative DNA helicase